LFWLPYIEIESNSSSFPNVKFTFDIVIISWNCRSNLDNFGAIFTLYICKFIFLPQTLQLMT
jgi:hypothetical protein